MTPFEQELELWVNIEQLADEHEREEEWWR